MTKSGVERNLPVSPYRFKIQYSTGNYIIFCFSSEKILQKFDNLRDEFYRLTKEGLSNRFHIGYYIALEVVDLKLYRQLESRGFYIYFNGSGIDKIGALAYDGRKLYVAEEKGSQ